MAREVLELPQKDVVADGGVEHEPFLVPVLVHDRDGRRIGREGSTVDALETRDRADELALAVALDAGDADDLAGANLEV